MTPRRSVAIVLGVLLVAIGGITAKAAALDEERRGLLVDVRAMSAQLADAHARSDYLSDVIAVAQEEREKLSSLLEVRPAFVDRVAALRLVLDGAGARIDSTSVRAAALDAQHRVLAEREDPQIVVDATATVEALIQKVNGEIATAETAPARAAETASLWSSTGPAGYARVRAALDRVGGSGVGLYESGSCAGGSAPACANSNGYIKYRADVAGWSEDRLNWAMAHELAHIYQFRVWGALNGSAGYHELFGGDPEFLANCMAVVRGYPGSVGCDAEQQVWASAVWVGVVG